MALEELAKYIEKGSTEAKIIPFPSLVPRPTLDSLCQYIHKRTE